MWLGRLLGVGDVLAVRFLQMALASALSVLIYLVTNL